MESITTGDNQVHNNHAAAAPSRGAPQRAPTPEKPVQSAAPLEPDRKPKAESVLKNLPEDFQAKIYHTCKLPRDKGGGYPNVAKWLGASDIQTSQAALCRFFQWYKSRQDAGACQGSLQAQRQGGSDLDQAPTPQASTDAAQQFSKAMAEAQRDPRVSLGAQRLLLAKAISDQRLQLGKANLALQQEKFLAAQRDEGLKAIKFCYEESRNYPEIYTRLEAALEDFARAYYRDNPEEAPLGPRYYNATAAAPNPDSHEPETH